MSIYVIGSTCIIIYLESVVFVSNLDGLLVVLCNKFLIFWYSILFIYSIYINVNSSINFLYFFWWHVFFSWYFYYFYWFSFKFCVFWLLNSCTNTCTEFWIFWFIFNFTCNFISHHQLIPSINFSHQLILIALIDAVFKTSAAASFTYQLIYYLITYQY